MNKKQIFRVVLNFLIGIGFLIVFGLMVFTKTGGILTAPGLLCLKFFTTLSNLLEAIVALIWAIHTLSTKGRVSRALENLKYIASVQLFITFLVVIAFLGPLFGYGPVCTGPNFWMHLVFPIAAIVEQIFLPELQVSVKANLCAILPVVIYGCFYVLNIAINGIGTPSNTNDWYGFLTWGLVPGIIIFIVICGFAFLTGLLFRGLWKAAHKNKQ